MGFLDGLFSGIATGLGIDQSTNREESMIRENRNWEKYMSDTSHVREVNDLKNAGLNPLLSVNAGASTPSGGGSLDAGDAIGGGVSSAQSMMRTAKDLEQADATIGKLDADADASRGMRNVQDTQAEANTASAKKSLADAASTLADIPEKRAKGTVYKGVQNLIDQAGKSGSSAVDMVNKSTDAVTEVLSPSEKARNKKPEDNWLERAGRAIHGDKWKGTYRYEGK